LENWLKTRGKRLANIAKLPELLRNQHEKHRSIA
jgi:hypothetical protein